MWTLFLGPRRPKSPETPILPAIRELDPGSNPVGFARIQTQIRTEIPQSTQELQNMVRARRSQDGLRRILHGPQARHISRHRSLGIEELRKIYSDANVSIRPRARNDQLERIKDFARVIGVDPTKVCIEPDAKWLDPEERKRAEIRAIMRAIKDELQKPPTDEIPRETVMHR